MKSKRQAKIMEIISTTNVETQEQLLKELQEAGFTSTQATISRDIKELRIVKELTSFGTYRYTTAAREVPSAFTGRLNTISGNASPALTMPRISSSSTPFRDWPTRRPPRWTP